jgi:hypothetical protein
VFCGGLGKSADLKLSDKGNQLYLDVERFLYMEISTVNFIQLASPNLPCEQSPLVFLLGRHGEARETLQNLCIFFVEPTIQKRG